MPKKERRNKTATKLATKPIKKEENIETETQKSEEFTEVNFEDVVEEISPSVNKPEISGPESSPMKLDFQEPTSFSPTEHQQDFIESPSINDNFQTQKSNGQLDGKIISYQTIDDGTLNEPVAETIKRDLFAVINKFKYVIQPTKIVRNTGASSAPLLYDWDLWGPLLLCTLMACLLQNRHTDHSASFTDVFLIVWCGAAVVTVNAQLLGGKISFFQSVCVLGYCILPLTVALVSCKFLIYFGSSSKSTFGLRAGLVFISLCWSIFSANTFLGYSQPYGKKALAHYPICLFYVVIAWIVITHYPH